MGITPISSDANPTRKPKRNPEEIGGVTISLYTHAHTDKLGPPVGTREPNQTCSADAMG